VGEHAAAERRAGEAALGEVDAGEGLAQLHRKGQQLRCHGAACCSGVRRGQVRARFSSAPSKRVAVQPHAAEVGAEQVAAPQIGAA
jgi:hypothetical protein